MDRESADERERAVVKLLELEYGFFHYLLLVPGIHPCASEQLHADFAIENRYERQIRVLRGMTLENAESIINAMRPLCPDQEAFIHASAWVRTIISIHGRNWRSHERLDDVDAK